MAKQYTFKNDGTDHSGLRACQSYLKEHGFSYGAMQRDDPMAVFKGEVAIAKWRNLNHYEKQIVDGTIESVGGFRNGGARLTLSDLVAPDEFPAD